MGRIIDFFKNIMPGVFLLVLVLSFMGFIGMIVNIKSLLIVDGYKKVFGIIIVLIIVFLFSFIQLLSY